MVRFFRYSILTAVFFSGMISVSAQMIYTTELGVHAGASYFSGDVKKPMLAGMQEDIGLTFRYVFNQRIALHADYHQTRARGAYSSFYPGVYPGELLLDNPMGLLDVTMAFNFFDYGYLEHVMYSTNVTPYLFGGVGAILLPQASRNQLTTTLPFGIGVKVRLNSRLHLNTQWTHRVLLGNDRLEGKDELDNPLKLNGTNWLNNDRSGSITIGISVGLTQRDCKCQNYQ
jgi:hypothetical protein